MAVGCASAQDRDIRPRRAYANPSALIAAEIGLHQLAEKKGLWKAYREEAAPGAELLVPDPVPAEPWLKGRAEPAELPGWQPYAAWISCDGSYGAVEGGWTEGGLSGLYAAIWQRQEDGSYKWLMRQRIGQDRPVSAPDMLSAHVAECPPRRKAEGTQPAPPAREKPGRGKNDKAVIAANAESDYSTDRTLYWRSGKDAAGTPWLLVAIRQNGTMQTVLGDALGAVAPAE